MILIAAESMVDYLHSPMLPCEQTTQSPKQRVGILNLVPGQPCRGDVLCDGLQRCCIEFCVASRQQCLCFLLLQGNFSENKVSRVWHIDQASVYKCLPFTPGRRYFTLVLDDLFSESLCHANCINFAEIII